MSFAFRRFSEVALSGGLKWPAPAAGEPPTLFVSAVLIKDTWIPDPSRNYLSDIAAGDRPRPKVVVGSRALVDGAADCTDIIFPKVPNEGFTYQGIVLIRDTAVAESSDLLVFHDTGVGWPVVPNGGNVVIQVSDGPNKLFRVKQG